MNPESRYDNLYWNCRGYLGSMMLFGAMAALSCGSGSMPRPQVRFSGRYVTPQEKARRRRANVIAKASRKRNRLAA